MTNIKFRYIPMYKKIWYFGIYWYTDFFFGISILLYPLSYRKYSKKIDMKWYNEILAWDSI